MTYTCQNPKCRKKFTVSKFASNHKFCCQQCRDIVNNGRRRSWKSHRTDSCHHTGRAVQVLLPGVADPYPCSRTELEYWQKQDAFPVGTVIRIGKQEPIFIQ